MSSCRCGCDASLASAPTCAHLVNLKLWNFRNYSALDLDLDARPVVLAGANGAGKTNLLEAVSFLAPGRGLRRAVYADVARLGGDGTWAVAARLDGRLGAATIGTGLAAAPTPGEGAQRRIRIDRAPVRSADILTDHLGVIWLTPAMDGLFTGPASDRRRFVDRLVVTLDGAHGSRVSAFERAMRQRNRLLEDMSAEAALLDAVEAQVAELAVAVAAARREAVCRLADLAGAAGPGDFPRAGLDLAGTLEAELGAGAAGEVEDAYRARLTRARGRDRAAGRMLEGPHRSDLAVMHRDKAMPAAQCSTGEQKGLLLGLVLAEARLVAEMTGAAPLLLLDEVAAHLDAARRGALYEALVALGAQAWLTGTDAALFAPLAEGAQHFEVSSGSARAV